MATDGSGQYNVGGGGDLPSPNAHQSYGPALGYFRQKAGTYKERIYVQRERGNIRVIGEDAEKTIITYDLNANLPGPDGKAIGTFRTPTVQIDGDGMIWENITMANSAGPVGQAVALRKLLMQAIALFSENAGCWAGRTRCS